MVQFPLVRWSVVVCSYDDIGTQAHASFLCEIGSHIVDKGAGNLGRKVEGFGGFHANITAPAGVNFT